MNLFDHYDDNTEFGQDIYLSKETCSCVNSWKFYGLLSETYVSEFRYNKIPTDLFLHTLEEIKKIRRTIVKKFYN